MSSSFVDSDTYTTAKMSGLPGFLEQSRSRDVGILNVGMEGRETRLSYSHLQAQALERLGEFHKAGLNKGDFLLFQLGDVEDFLVCLWACFLGGVLAVPTTIQDQYDMHLPASQRLVELSKRLNSAPILTRDRNLSEALSVSTLVLGSLESGEPIVDPQLGQEPALVLLTSGSTSRSKLVPLSSENLAAMAWGTILQNEFTPSEVTLNWMPLDHVGAISFLSIMSVILGCEQIHVPTRRILADPLRWLELIERHKASVSWAPNFAFGLILKQAKRLRAESFDLSSMRFLVNAGEMVSRQTMLDCLSLLEEHQLPSDALRPAFGMSETCSGITWSRGMSREQLQQSGPHLSLGLPIPGAQLRIVDQTGAEVEAGERGLLELRGPSVLQEYLLDPEATAQAFTPDHWFKTGDVGTLCRGELILTGRMKEQIILAGINYSAQDIESVVQDLEGVDQTNVAAFSILDQEEEKLALVYCLEPAANPRSVEKQIRSALGRQLGVAVFLLKHVAAESIPKTSIGKIQRAILKKQYEAGELQSSTRPRTATPERRVNEGDLLRRIRGVWARVLETDIVGPNDGFFELGGHSLLVPQMQLELERELQMTIPISVLFSCPTPQDMAAELAQSNLEESPEHTREPLVGGDIAVIGMALRFPGANEPQTFWENLCLGKESITQLSKESLLASGVRADLLKDPNYVRARPLIDQADGFDAEFFGYSRADAQLLDPQQRVALECCWSCLEDAGYAPDQCDGNVGVFLGASTNTYLLNRWTSEESVVTLDSTDGFRMMVANDKDFLPTRVSYHLNLKGPSVNIQTACSTSLVTIHTAVQSLRAGESDMAMAGGVALNYPQETGYLYQEGMILSSDGHCRAFDEKADGTIFGNGAGVVLLKRLEEAVQDGDHIYAVVKGTAINNDGALKQSFNAPNGKRQTDVVRQALNDAKVDASSIGFLEAHGTGTNLGDPIEFQALARALEKDCDKPHYCALGSVKTNIGHLQIASGVAGFIKTVLALHHGEIPPTLHFNKPNPLLGMEKSPFYINSKVLPWRESESPRRAAVNSLGIGGTNAHIILEQAPTSRKDVRPERSHHLVALSAASKPALNELVRNLAKSLSERDYDLADLAYTLDRSRSNQAFRRVILARTVSELRTKLLEPDDSSDIQAERANLVFAFSGQGSGYFGMGRELYQSEPSFREAFDECEEFVIAHCGESLVEYLYGEERKSFKASPLLQVSIFSIQMSLVATWKSYGIEPNAVLGHSLGEYAAACTAGLWDVETAIRLLLERGRLMSELEAGGAMLSVSGEPSVWKELVGSDAVVAAFNTPTQTVLSGSRVGLAKIAEKLKLLDISHGYLKVDFAFHSPLAQPVVKPFSKIVSKVSYREPKLPIISTLSGKQGWPDMAKPDYWTSQILEPVRFHQAIDHCKVDHGSQFLEVGPGAQLCALGLDSGASSWHPSLSEKPKDWSVLLNSLGELYQRGRKVDWDAVNAPFARGKITLPTYPFQRQSYTLHSRRGYPACKTKGAVESYNTSTRPYLEEHRVHGRVVLSAASLILLCQEYVHSHHPDSKAIKNLRLLTQAVLGPNSQIEVRTSASSEMSLEVFLRDNSHGDWGRIANFEVGSLKTTPQELTHASEELSELRPPDLYQQFRKAGLDHGPTFQTLQSVAIGENSVQGSMLAPPCARETPRHPGLLDGALQLLASALVLRSYTDLHLPVAVKEIRWSTLELPNPIQAEGTLCFRDIESGLELGDLDIRDPEGCLLLSIRGLSVRPASFQVHPNLLVPYWKLSPSSDRGVDDWAIIDPQQLMRGQLPHSRHFTSPDDLGDGSWPAIVWLLSPLGGPGSRIELQALLEPVLQFLKSEIKRPEPRQIIFATQQCQPVNRGVLHPELSLVWGLCKSALREHPELKIKLLDLGPEEPTQWKEQISKTRASSGTALAWNENKLFELSRRTWEPISLIQPLAPNCRLVRTAHDRKNWHLASLEKPLPKPNEVLIETAAHGLNFRDVLSHLGKVPIPEGDIVGECSGKVIQVGNDVKDIRVGNLVCAISDKPFQRYVALDSSLVVPLESKSKASLGQAAGTSICFITAYYALKQFAQLESGDTVLIHSAASGVGLASVQLAQHMGLRVLATAHPSKWPFLRSLNLEYIASSRTSGFTRCFQEAIPDLRVNLVLNSLSDELRQESLLILQGQGTFIDLSKLSTDEAKSTRDSHPTLDFQTFDLSELPREVLAKTLESVSKLQLDQRLKPLPTISRPMEKSPQVFREMAAGRHIGKYVLTYGPASGTVLITGATGGIGQQMVREHIRLGYKSLLLLSRTVPPELVEQELSHLAIDEGATLHWRRCDVANFKEVKDAIASIESPILGVIHAAGVHQDGVLINQTWQTFWTVMECKILGTQNLHRACSHQPLEFFELFSSAASWFGSPGQSNYSAANAFLDSFAWFRQSQGLPAQVFNWGAWQDVGMARSMVRSSPIQEIASITLQEALECYRLTKYGPTQVMIWNRAVPSRLKKYGSEDIRDLVQSELTRALGLEEPVDQEESFLNLGMDSLLSLEIRNRLGRRLDLRLPSDVLYRYPNPKALIERLEESLGGDQAKLHPLQVGDEPMARETVTSPLSEPWWERYGSAVALLLFFFFPLFLTLDKVVGFPQIVKPIEQGGRHSQDFFERRLRYRHGIRRLYSALPIQLFSQPTLGIADRPLVGKQGWWFLPPSRRAALPAGPLSAERLESWISYFQETQENLSQNDIEYLIVVPPMKESVYPEYLPDWFVQPESNLEQLLELETSKTLNVVDVTPQLLKQKREFPLFSKMSMHWNEIAGFFASKVLLEGLHISSEFDSFEIETVTGTAELPRLAGVLKEENKLILTPRDPVSWGETPANYRGVRRAVTTSNFQKDSKTAVVFHDSFGWDMHPFLAPHFRRLTFVRHVGPVKELVELERPDMVIHVLSDAQLLGPPPPQLSRLAPPIETSFPSLSTEELFENESSLVTLLSLGTATRSSEFPSDGEAFVLAFPKQDLEPSKIYIAKVELSAEKAGELELRRGKPSSKRRGYFYAFRDQRRLEPGKHAYFFVLEPDQLDNLRIVLRNTGEFSLDSVSLRALSPEIADKELPLIQLPPNPMLTRARPNLRNKP